MVKWLPQGCLKIQYLFNLSSAVDVLQMGFAFWGTPDVVPGDAFAFCETAANDFLTNNVYAAIHAATSSVCKIIGTRSYYVSTDGLLYGSEVGAGGGGVSGLLANGLLLPQMAITIQQRAANLGRRYRGRSILPGVVTPTVEGKVATTQATAIGGIETALLAPDAIGAVDLTPIVIHPGSPPSYSTVQSVGYNNTITTLRSRKVGVGS